MGDYLRKTFANNLAENAVFSADSDDGYHLPGNMAVDSYNAYYKPFDGENAVTISIKLVKAEKVTHVVIKEHIPMSQRIERYVIEAKLADGTWQEVNRGTTVGYKRIARFDPVTTDELRIRIQDSRVCPIISFVGIY